MVLVIKEVALALRLFSCAAALTHYMIKNYIITAMKLKIDATGITDKYGINTS